MELGSPEWRRWIIEGAAALGLAVDHRQAESFAVHAREMLHWNRVTNLTTITHPLEIAAKHVLDSLAAALCIRPGARLLDVGSGAGFPGIPLKIFDPSFGVTLVDSSRKKVSFLKHVIRTLGLVGIDVLHCRAQDLAKSAAVKTFDVVISRALTDVADFAAMALPLMAMGGCGIAMKGRGIDAEWAALAERRCSGAAGPQGVLEMLTFKRVEYFLPYAEAERVLVVFERKAETGCES